MEWLDGPSAIPGLNCGTRPTFPTDRQQPLDWFSRENPHQGMERRELCGGSAIPSERWGCAHRSSNEGDVAQMKWKLFIGALVVSAGMCSQSFGFELLDRMLGGGHGGCGNCCAPSCCEPSCCEAAACCEPTCCEAAACCEPSCCEAAACCEPSCCEAASCCDSCNTCGHRHCGLFKGLKGLFDCNRCCKSSCCEPACCEPACCEQACEPACCEAAACCDPCNTCGNSCCKKRHCGLLAGIFRCKKSCCHSACNTCCDNGCGNACGNGGCCGGEGGDAPAPAAGGEEAAPMPPAPMADPSASIQRGRQVVKAAATGSVVRRNYR